MQKTNDVIALGNTLMDFLVEIDENKLLELNLKKGEMHLVDEGKARELLARIEQDNLRMETASGGSAANTIKGIAFLGGKAVLSGKVGYDEHGLSYIQEIEKYGVTSRIKKHHKTTGHSLTMITPDAERTFSVHLGAALELYKEDILESDIASSKILHIEGYQLEGPTKETVLHAIELAKKNNTLVSIDLADPALIRRNKDFFKELVTNHVDIVFLNELEAKEFTGLEEEEALKQIAKDVSIAIIKLGEKGSMISKDGIITKVNAYSARTIDTTGAGDTYAAGFLYGFCNGWNEEESGKLGSYFASRITEEMGVRMENIDGEKVKEAISKKADIAEGNKVKIGIIGGSGLDNPDILAEVREIEMDTPYGSPSSPLKMGKIGGREVVLLARHGREHTIPPTQVNFRANIYALMQAGCTHIIATTACGSLREEIGRGNFVIIDQFIDFTRHRPITFYDHFEAHKPEHVPMAEPFDKELREVLTRTCEEMELKHHQKGTVITIEGPRFSTKAESHMFRSWGADVINMSIAPEAILAGEVGIPYAAVAMSTDFDCWKENEATVTWEEVLKVFNENVDKVTNLLTRTIPKIIHSCECCHDREKQEQETVQEDRGASKEEKPKEKTSDEFDLKSTIRTIPHWPKQGVMFRDITTLLENPRAFDYVIKKFKERYESFNIDKIVGIESRGFIFGAALAREMGLPFIIIRKKGKLPAETISHEYELEYGTDTIEIHKDAVNPGENVLIIDDLLATGGTMKAACQLIEKLDGNVIEAAFVIDLPDLKGREKLQDYNTFHLIEFEGD